MAGRPLVGQPEHLVDDPVVRHAEAEGEAPLQHRLHRQRLLREGDRVARLHGDHGGADLDAGRLEADERGRGEGVELVGDLGHPDRCEAGLLGPPGVGAEAVDLGGVAAPLGPDHHPDAHGSTSP